jgi:hypothetical protein
MVHSLQLPSKLLILICLLSVSVEASQQFFFKHGFTAPYNQEYVNDVLYEPVDVTSKTLLELTFREDTRLVTPTRFSFYLIQSLDVYSTYRGLKYSCVYEKNPAVFGGSEPSAAELILYKAVIIGIMKSIYGQKADEWQFFQSAANYTTGFAVVNNYEVIKEAKDYCPR